MGGLAGMFTGLGSALSGFSQAEEKRQLQNYAQLTQRKNQIVGLLSSVIDDTTGRFNPQQQMQAANLLTQVLSGNQQQGGKKSKGQSGQQPNRLRDISMGWLLGRKAQQPQGQLQSGAQITPQQGIGNPPNPLQQSMGQPPSFAQTITPTATPQQLQEQAEAARVKEAGDIAKAQEDARISENKEIESQKDVRYQSVFRREKGYGKSDAEADEIANSVAYGIARMRPQTESFAEKKADSWIKNHPGKTLADYEQFQYDQKQKAAQAMANFRESVAERRANFPKQLNAQQMVAARQAISTGNSLKTSIDTILNHADVLDNLDEAVQARLSGTAVGRILGATPDEISVQQAFTRLQEQVNQFRKAYAATGFRGQEGWNALQSLAGNYWQNPDLTKGLLQAARQDIDQFNDDVQQALPHPMGAPPAQQQSGALVNPYR